MKKLANLVQRRLNHHHLDGAALASEVIFKAEKYLSERFSGFSDQIKPYQYKGAELYIAVEHAVLMQEVWNDRLDLLAYLNDFFGGQIKKICVKHLTIL